MKKFAFGLCQGLKCCTVFVLFCFFHRGSTFSANKALELVRAALQPTLNAEIESILKNYQEVGVT